MAGYEKFARLTSEKGSGLKRERLLASRIQPSGTIFPFRFKSLDGKTVSSDDLKGRVAVIDFWGVWCGACVAAMPDFQKLASKYRDDPEVAIVSIDVYDPVPRVEKWVRNNAITVPVLLESDYVAKAKVDSFPTTWFLDRNGLLNYVINDAGGNLVEEGSWLIEDLKRR